MDAESKRQAVRRFECIAEQCLRLSHDLADLDGIFDGDGAKGSPFLPSAVQVGDLARRFEALAATFSRRTPAR